MENAINVRITSDVFLSIRALLPSFRVSPQHSCEATARSAINTIVISYNSPPIFRRVRGSRATLEVQDLSSGNSTSIRSWCERI